MKTTEYSLNKEYIDKQHTTIRRLLLAVLLIIGIAIGAIVGLLFRMNAMQKIIDTCK